MITSIFSLDAFSNWRETAVDATPKLWNALDTAIVVVMNLITTFNIMIVIDTAIVIVVSIAITTIIIVVVIVINIGVGIGIVSRLQEAHVVPRTK